MADFIAPIIEAAIAILAARTPALLSAAGLDPFVDIKKGWSSVTPNFPGCYVMPHTTVFDEDTEQARHQHHAISIRLAILGPDPETLTGIAMDYVKAVDDAIAASEQAYTPGANDWPTTVKRVWISTHQYGPLYDTGRGIAREPEILLVIETEEL